jgi:hypothetical protein
MEYISTGLGVANKLVNGRKDEGKEMSSAELIKDLSLKVSKWENHKCYSGNILSFDFSNKFNWFIIVCILCMIFYINYLRNELQKQNCVDTKSVFVGEKKTEVKTKNIEVKKENNEIKTDDKEEDVDEDMF